MAKYPVIGITGPARAGKDTAASLLMPLTRGYRYAFADPIRAMLRAGLGIDMNDAYWLQHKEDVIPAFGRSPRQLMQSIGTEWGRTHVCERIWLLLAQDTLMRNGPGMIITDVRFENEAAWIRGLRGKVVHITRAAAPGVVPHLSEVGVVERDGDWVVPNDGTMEDLQRRLTELFG